MVNALGELSVQFPVSGSFNAFFSRFLEPSFGGTFGILYAASWCISLPSELIAAAMTISIEHRSESSCVGCSFWVVIVVINLLVLKVMVKWNISFPLLKYWLSLDLSFLVFVLHVVLVIKVILVANTGTTQVHLIMD